MKKFCQRLLVLTLLLMPSASHANFFDFFKGNTESAESKRSDIATPDGNEDLSDCGKTIANFRHFLHDAKICKQDNDCISMAGICPLGCVFYLNKNFEGIISNRIEEVSEQCRESVCAYRCAKINVRPVCIKNKCQARTK